ncbi:MAG: hypothetical protein FJY29_00130 [Betaproteobacteria bacterium]|nr:hypothetical protein [Betaproteobacteria bacterium]
MNTSERLSSTAQKVRINPHVEAHGNYSIEWSYHFPIAPGQKIEGEFELSFPSDKVPGAARAALSEANLSTTRLSFADSASSVRFQSLIYYRDTLWLLGVLGKDSHHEESLDRNLVPRARRFFLHRAKDYWSEAFLPRLGIIFQSDLKRCRSTIKKLVQTSDVDNGMDWEKYASAKHELLSSLRSAFRIIHAHHQWEALCAEENQIKADKKSEATISEHDAEDFTPALANLAEFVLMLATATIGELQSSMRDTHDAYESHFAVLRSGSISSKIELDASIEFTKNNLRRVVREQRWLSEWARIVSEWRIMCKLPSLMDIAADAQMAAEYFERLRELKRLHYAYWDLKTDLVANEKKVDFWIGGGAAGVSAAFAFLGTFAWIHYQGLGLGSFQDGTALQESGLVAFAIFAAGNVIVYVLKDRLKEWLKERLRERFNYSAGKWLGRCYQLAKDDQNKGQRKIEVAEIERETRWEKNKKGLSFRVWESFHIAPEVTETAARIGKQTWRLPLDEILHSMDDSRHVLKLPSLDGVPREVTVKKRALFNYKIAVRVYDWKNRELTLIDSAQQEGRILSSGDKITSVEIRSS